MICSVLDRLRYFFFFKQKTSYEMRISDWSSDVCSSDLLENAGRIDEQDLRVVLERDAHQPRACGLRLGADDRDLLADQCVDERRLAGIGSADDGDKAAGLGHFTGSGNGATIPRFRRRPIRRRTPRSLTFALSLSRSEEHSAELQ